jgi:glycosyltransferase involved in cell wall biosynthesis
MPFMERCFDLMSDTTAEKKAKQMSVLVLGLRGFPGVPGGVETHAENLYPIMAGMGVKVICVTRSPYHDLSSWSGVEFLRVWAPRSKFLEAILHSILGVVRAAFIRPDVVHIHAVGPSIVVPLARLFGLKVVVTHHGPDYDREKWGALAKGALRFGEWCGMQFANERIVISPVIADLVLNRYGAKSTIIPNGVKLPVLDSDASILDKYGLPQNKYVLLVSRFVPEKRHIDLIDAFEKAAVEGLKLALVGDADHPDSYEKALKERAAANPDVVLTGFLGGNDLKAVFQFARLFVLPSSHEGLPISLLEALSFGLPCVASGIAANRSVGLDDEAYFELGDIDQLATRIAAVSNLPWGDTDRDATRRWVAEIYDWNRIAEQTAEIYQKAIKTGA